jgi:Holliday junction resolvase
MNCKAKAKGSRRERQTIALLQTQGYACTKSGGSLGMWDVIGIGVDDVLLVQCKSNRWPGAVELEAMRAFVAPKNCRKIIHRWIDGRSTPDVKEL